MNRYIAVVLVLGILPCAGLHAQQTAQATLRVSARVQAVCEIISSDLSFEKTNTAQSASPLLGTTHLRAICTPNTGYRVGFSQGMSSGPDTVTGVGTGLPQDHTVFGSVPATQVVPAEGYNDAVTVRIYY